MTYNFTKFNKFLFLNISIVVVTNRWSTKYVIYLTKLLKILDIIVLQSVSCIYHLCIKRGKYMSVNEIKDISFIKHLSNNDVFI